MKYRQRLFELSKQIRDCWFLLSIVNGEMAQYFLERDLEDLEDHHYRIKKALYSHPSLKGKLP
jgi:hypothetical protein